MQEAQIPKTLVMPVRYGDNADKLTPELRAYLESQRDSLLRQVNGLEVLLGITPSTASIRRYWRNCGKPDIPD